MSTYYVSPEADQFQPLYERARQMEGVSYVGSVGQARLAADLSGFAALAYPSTFAETSCITIIEAMAAGAAVITTRLGALPETAQRHASILDLPPTKQELIGAFAKLVISQILEMRRNPKLALEERETRLEFVRTHYQWPARAKEWESWLSQIVNESKRS